MIYNIKYSSLALSSLNEIYDYISISLYNTSAARNIVFGIMNTIHELEEFPKRNPLSDLPKLNLLGIRQTHYKNFIILYKVDASSVLIVNIFYEKRDINSILLN